MVVMLLGAVLGLPWALLGGLDLLKQWAWLRAGRRLGLQFEPGGLLAGDALHGRRNGFALWILAHHRRQTFARLRMPDLPDGVELRAAGWLKAPGTMTVGDRTFDRKISIRGPDGPLRARLGRSRRRRLTAQLLHPPGPLGAELWVAGGEVAFACPGMILRPGRLERIVKAMEELANTLTTPRGVAEQLQEIACDQDEPHAVREGALRALVVRHEASVATQKAAGDLLNAPEPTLRLWAARARARTVDGARVLQDLVRNKDIPASLRAEALRRLMDADTISVRTTALLVLENGPPELRTTAAQRLASYPDSLRALLHRTSRETDENAQLALLQGVLRGTDIGHDPKREPALLRLAHSNFRQIRNAAVIGLGRIGGRPAIAPLMAIRRTRWHDPTLGRQINATINQIRARMGPAQAGQLSITEGPTGGNLGLSSVGPGTLALTDPKGGIPTG